MTSGRRFGPNGTLPPGSPAASMSPKGVPPTPMAKQPPAAVNAPLEDVLAAVWLTHPLERETRARLAALGTVKPIAGGQQLVREGETATELGILLSGRVGLRMRVPERGAVTILTVEPGDVIGWSALVPPHRSTSTAVVLVGGEMAVFDAAVLRSELATDAQLAAQLYPLLLAAVSRRLDATRFQLLDLFTHRWVEPW
jgi:CRP-like cAMP-binding protein